MEVRGLATVILRIAVPLVGFVVRRWWHGSLQLLELDGACNKGGDSGDPNEFQDLKTGSDEAGMFVQWYSLFG